VPDTDPEGLVASTTLHEVLTAAREAGFLGPGPIAPQVRHAEGFLALARRLSPADPRAGTTRLLDLGSGGGLPGLVLAAQWLSCAVVLLDAGTRRAEFLRRAVLTCGLGDRVSVVHQRAEVCGRDPSYRGTFDGVVVRSFGAPAVVAECGAPFLRPGGWLLVSEPPGSPEEDVVVSTRWPTGPLAQFGLEPGEFVREEFGYQVLHQKEACPERFPRRDGVPAKNPLF
jgi:16S rRNA (guanine527-N7)-methyltransferase